MFAWLTKGRKLRQLSATEIAQLSPVRIQLAGYPVQHWQKEGSLLAALDKSEVPVRSSCRSGNCGTCVAYLKAGEVGYVKEVSFPLEGDEILMCSCVPLSDLQLVLPDKPVGPRRRKK